MQQTMSQQRQWTKLQYTVSNIKDALGKSVDPGIADAVTSILALGFPTEGSCEGHVGHGSKTPWIDIGTNLPATYIKLFERDGLPHKSGKPPHVADVFEKYPELATMRNTNVCIQKRLRTLLTAFYTTYSSPSNSQLILKVKGCYGVMRLIDEGFTMQETRSKKQQAAMLRMYQQEMQAFARFLKQRFFQSTPEKL